MGDRFVIVGSGLSAKGFVPPDDVTVIAVNGAIDWISRADYFFTLDPSPENLNRLKCRRPGVMYCTAGVPQPDNSCMFVFDRIAKRGKEPKDKGSPEWWLWRWSAVKGLTKKGSGIHTGNSAWGALGMAYKFGAKKVALVGIDANQEPRVEGGNPNNLSHLPLLFNSAIGQVDMVSCGLMDCDIPKMTIKEGMKWLTS